MDKKTLARELDQLIAQHETELEQLRQARAALGGTKRRGRKPGPKPKRKPEAPPEQDGNGERSFPHAVGGTEES